MTMEIEAITVNTSNKSMLLGAATGIIGWLSQINWIGICGALVALVGLIVSVYFQIRRDRRETREHEARMRNYESNDVC